MSIPERFPVPRRRTRICAQGSHACFQDLRRRRALKQQAAGASGLLKDRAVSGDLQAAGWPRPGRSLCSSPGPCGTSAPPLWPTRPCEAARAAEGSEQGWGCLGGSSDPLAGAAITKHHQLGPLDTEIICSPFWTLEVLLQASAGAAPSGASVLAGGRPSPSWSQCGPRREPVCVLISWCMSIMLGRGPSLRPHFTSVPSPQA